MSPNMRTFWLGWIALVDLGVLSKARFPLEPEICEPEESLCHAFEEDAEEGLLLLQRRQRKLQGLAPSQASASVSPQSMWVNEGIPPQFDQPLESDLSAGAIREMAVNNSALVGPNGTVDLGFAGVMARCGRVTSAAACSQFLAKHSEKLFDSFSEHHKGWSLTEEEKQDFGDRFKELVLGASKVIVAQRSVSQKYSKWRGLLTQGYASMQPVVPKSLVDEVNKAHLGWTASHEDMMPSVSISQAASRLGLLAGAKELQDVSEDTARHEKEDLLLMEGKQEPTGPYDVRENWPMCKKVSSHVRFQTCNNCWSHSTALIAETRLCIATNGAFNGKHAWLSQSFIAACRPDGMNYCAGGSGSMGFQTVNLWGVPTGAPDAHSNAEGDVVSCQPQMMPYEENVRCPGACSPFSKYPRSLQDDLYFLHFTPRALKPAAAQTSFMVKKALMEDGPILIGMLIFQDFYAYKDGVYKPLRAAANKHLGGHAVTGMGFGPGYILCVNSWGPQWGINGAFKVAPEAIDVGYFLPGPMTLPSDPPPPKLVA